MYFRDTVVFVVVHGWIGHEFDSRCAFGTKNKNIVRLVRRNKLLIMWIVNITKCSPTRPLSINWKNIISKNVQITI